MAEPDRNLVEPSSTGGGEDAGSGGGDELGFGDGGGGVVGKNGNGYVKRKGQRKGKLYPYPYSPSNSLRFSDTVLSTLY